MITTKELLARAKEAQGIPSNYRLARVLDIPETTVQRWNTGRNRPDDESAMRLAQLAGLDPCAVVAAIRAERSEDGPMRDLWESMAKRLQAAAAVALTAIVSVWITLVPAGDAQAMARGAGQVAECELGAALSIHCRQSLRRILRRLRAALHRLHPHPLMGAHATA